MTYFCTKCQAHHPIEDISADMWGICHTDIGRGVSDCVLGMSEQADAKDRADYNEWEEILTGFLNRVETVNGGEARINAMFPLNADNVLQLENVQHRGSTISGRYQVTLGKIHTICENNTEDPETLTLLQKYRQYLHGRADTPVYSVDLTAQFTPSGALDMITDKKGVPFSMDGRLHGMVRICPHCGQELSRVSGRAEEIVIALAGSPRAGKTSSMVAMVSSLLSGMCPGMYVVPVQNDQAWEDLAVEIEKHRTGHKVIKTTLDIFDAPAYSFLVHLNDRVGTERVITVVDIPGEFWENGRGLTDKFFSQYARLYENIDCIWYVTSKASVRLSDLPFRNLGQQQEANLQVGLKNYTSESEEQIRNSGAASVMNNFGMLRNLFAAKLNKPLPPTLVIVTKSDFCISQADVDETCRAMLFPVGNPNVAQWNSQHIMESLAVRDGRIYGLIENRFWQLSAMVRQFIQEKNPRLLNAIETNCESRFYVALSPYGRAALDRLDPNACQPMPFHEIFPMLWTLAITGALPVAHQVKWLSHNIFGAVNNTTTSMEFVPFDYREESAAWMQNLNQEQQQDAQAFHRDVSSNLLMHGNYVMTTINHGRH